MEEETIFQGTQEKKETAGQPNQPVSAPTENLPPDTPAPSTLGNELVPPGGDFGNKGSRFEFLKGKFFRILLGAGVLILIFFLLFSFIFSKFGNKNEGPVTLTYWGLWEDPGIMSSLISEFERENPGIKIDYSKQDIKGYRERLAARSENGNGPDIFKFHNSWYPMISDLLLPLPSDVISKEDFQNRFYEVAQKDLIKNGAIYGLPLSIDTLVLFINTDKLSAGGYSPPSNWNDFISLANNLTVKNGDGKIESAGAAIGTFENISHAPDIISLLLAQNGVDMKDPTKTKTRVSDAIDFYTAFASGEGNVWDSSLDPSVLAFAEGNVGMIFAYSWDYFTVEALNPNLNFQIHKVPQLSSDSPKNIASYWADGVSSKSKYQDQAFLFLKFLASKETQEKLYSEEAKTRKFGEIYSDISLASLISQDPELKVFTDQARSATSSYFLDSTFDNGINTKLNNYLKDTVNSVLSGSSTETAVETLFQGYNQILGQYEPSE